jgi:regulator of CtrA degradation
MSLAQANKEKTKVKLAADVPIDQNVIKGLPAQLRELIERSSILHDKVRRLDATIHAPVPEEQASATPLDRQLGLLKAAFERRDEHHEKP